MNPVNIEQWEFQQKKAFKNWANYWLRSGGYTERKIENVIVDVQDGVILINLFQALSGQQIHRYVKQPKLTAQKLENLSIVLNAFKEYGIVANVSGEDFLKGQEKFILGYLWDSFKSSKFVQGLELFLARAPNQPEIWFWIGLKSTLMGTQSETMFRNHPPNVSRMEEFFVL